MKIATYLSDDKTLFRQLKTQTTGDWRLIVSGEWSESPYHQGDLQFYARSSIDKINWGILARGFPNRIVVAASFDEPTEIEFASAIMLKVLENEGGEYIELAHQFGEIDSNLFWDTYISTPKP